MYWYFATEQYKVSHPDLEHLNVVKFEFRDGVTYNCTHIRDAICLVVFMIIASTSDVVLVLVAIVDLNCLINCVTVVWCVYWCGDIVAVISLQWWIICYVNTVLHIIILNYKYLSAAHSPKIQDFFESNNYNKSYHINHIKFIIVIINCHTCIVWQLFLLL